MRRHLAFLVVLAVAPLWHGVAAADWIFSPSYFSHDAKSGERVAQYAPEEVRYAPYDPTFLRSGYRQNRIAIRGASGSVDRLHVVETWGAGEAIRPYGEWQRPFRAGATPYGPWGNPQGPWTSPYGSWENPYGLGQIPNVFDFRSSRPYGGYPGAGPYGRPPGGPGGGHGGPGGGHGGPGGGHGGPGGGHGGAGGP